MSESESESERKREREKERKREREKEGDTQTVWNTQRFKRQIEKHIHDIGHLDTGDTKQASSMWIHTSAL